jgi:hypothetical protein
MAARANYGISYGRHSGERVLGISERADWKK